MGGCRIGGDGAWCCQSVTVNGTDLGLLPPAGRSFASRCVAADRDITVRDPAFCGELLPLVHAVRRCIHADAKLDAAIALRLLPRRGRRPVATEVAVACTQPRAHPRPRARPRVVAWRCICMGARSRQRGILERTTRSAVRTTRRPRRIALSVGGRLSLRRVLERIDPCSYASTALAMATSQRHRHVGLSVCACIAVCFHVAHASRIRPRACFSCSSTAIAPLHSCEHDATPPEANWTSSDFSLCFQVE